MRFYRNVIFPRFFDLVVQHKAFNELRAATLAKVSGRILEIGIGTGWSLDWYPAHVQNISAVEPNPGMKREFEKKAARHRITVDFHLTGAEAMPFNDSAFDTVVSTLTLCSIPKLQDALREIQRVLKPDGRFVFLDHGLSSEKPVARLQHLLNPLQHLIGAGCKLTVNVEEELRTAGFKIDDVKKYYVSGVPKFIGSVYEGTATKAATDKNKA